MNKLRVSVYNLYLSQFGPTGLLKNDGATFLYSRCECLVGFLIANSLKVQSTAKLVSRGHSMFLLCNII